MIMDGKMTRSLVFHVVRTQVFDYNDSINLIDIQNDIDVIDFNPDQLAQQQ